MTNGDAPPPAPLPRRDPRPLAVHALIDGAVAFLALVILFFILAIPFWVTIVIAVVVGIAAAPYTRRAEERALAARPEPEA